MHIKKKTNRDERAQRRIREAEIAESKLAAAREAKKAVAKTGVNTNSAVANPKAFSYSTTLPVNEIKIDLMKNIAFAVFSVVVLVTLMLTNFGLDQFKTLFSI